jgi:thioredoxin-like negative regulator of GroEL
MTIENSQKIRLNILSEVVSRIGELEKKALQNPKATLEELELIQHEKFTDDAEQRLAYAVALEMQARCLNILNDNLRALEKLKEAEKVLNALPQTDERVRLCLGKKV